MCIKWMLDFRSGLLTSPNQEVNDKLDILVEEIEKLKGEKPKKQMKRIRSISGRTITEKEE